MDNVLMYTFNRAKRLCVDCEGKYKPMSPSQKYCSKCRKEREHGLKMSYVSTQRKRSKVCC